MPCSQTLQGFPLIQGCPAPRHYRDSLPVGRRLFNLCSVVICVVVDQGHHLLTVVLYFKDVIKDNYHLSNFPSHYDKLLTTL